MSKLRIPLLVAVLTVALLAGCFRPATPNVTPTPSQADQEAQLMGTMEAEAVAYTATQQAQATLAAIETPMPTEPSVPLATEPPPAEPTAEPTEAPPLPTEAPPLPTEAPPPPTEAPTAEASPAAPSGGETTYTVQPGDNLFRIALRYGVALETLAAYNGITNPNQIRVGQVLRIPGGTTPPAPPPAGGTTYTVQPGDNLFRIALRFNMSYMYLAAYNGIANPHQIYVGQVLRIPAVP